MKSTSAYAILISLAFYSLVRLNYHHNNNINGNNATCWDSFGYYQYLPALFIYKDVDKLNWVAKVDSTYHVTGGDFYQATLLENGNYVGKYLGGVAIMELPFFAIGHVSAGLVGYSQDGFSAPYQYAIIWGAIFWFFIGLIFLRKVLLNYYSESTTAFTILLLVIASNLVQYVAVTGAMSHAYIFPLYAMMLYFAMRWSETPKIKYAIAIGLILGIATISRPTELIMLFIPLFWLAKGHTNFKDKWKEMLQNKAQIIYAIVAFFVAIFPQLIYWKYVTGSWIYDVGSKWNFHNPWWRVLFGFEKGWFIYTPVAILFVLGLFFLKQKPFRIAVIVFCILNIWIVIAWHEWRYGASYSTRALTQSYPVFALALAALIERWLNTKGKYLLYLISIYFCFVNVFQIWQYNKTILHFDDMNAKYYSAIYLDANPSPLDYSLLDTDEQINSSNQKKLKILFDSTFIAPINLVFSSLNLFTLNSNKSKAECEATLLLTTKQGLNTGSIIVSSYRQGVELKQKQFRLALPDYENGKSNMYQHHYFVGEEIDSVVWSLNTFDKMYIDKLNFNLKVNSILPNR